MKILNGKEVSEKIRDDLKPRIQSLIQKNNRPGIGIILIGDNIESKTYVNMKQKMCKELKMKTELHHLQEDVNQKTVIETIQKLNNSPTIHGIIVQLPLPNNLNTNVILNSVSYEKDVDGFHTLNAGKLYQNRNVDFIPCTPKGCIDLLKYYEIEILKKNAVIIGSSNLVGLPLSMLLLQRGATVTICNENTKDIREHLKNADLVFSCCGVAHIIKEDYVKRDVIIVDIGVNKITDDTNKKGYRLVGDVDYENVKNKASYITPVPGGVGPMTVITLMEQTVKAAELNTNFKL